MATSVMPPTGLLAARSYTCKTCILIFKNRLNLCLQRGTLLVAENHTVLSPGFPDGGTQSGDGLQLRKLVDLIDERNIYTVADAPLLDAPHTACSFVS